MCFNYRNKTNDSTIYFFMAIAVSTIFGGLLGHLLVTSRFF